MKRTKNNKRTKNLRKTKKGMRGGAEKSSALYPWMKNSYSPTGALYGATALVPQPNLGPREVWDLRIVTNPQMNLCTLYFVRDVILYTNFWNHGK